MKALSVLALVPLALLPTVGLTETADHGGHAGHAMPGAATTPSTEAFMAANARMHGAMDIPFTGNADADFLRGMIPHHQGAVDMAKIVLEHGQDPEVRKLAEAIIAAQEAEIAWMTRWLADHGY